MAPLTPRAGRLLLHPPRGQQRVVQGLEDHDVRLPRQVEPALRAQIPVITANGGGPLVDANLDKTAQQFLAEKHALGRLRTPRRSPAWSRSSPRRQAYILPLTDIRCPSGCLLA